MTARLVAWQVLRSGSPTPLRLVEPFSRRAGLDARDRGLVRRLVGIEIRRRATLRAIVAKFARGKPNPDLMAHLHLGLAQLFFLDRVPDHAAINETGAAVHATSGPSKVRYVNAILRAALRARCEGPSGDPRRDLVGRDLSLAEPVFRDPAEHPFLWAEDALSLPASLAKRWTKRLGRERMEELARLALDEAPLSVRLVTGDSDGLRAELAAAGLDPRSTGHERVLLLAASDVEALAATDAFRRGAVTVQGESALRAAELVEAREGERILDLCAAPGGKTAVLAATGARVVALDRSPARLRRLGETVDRLGVRTNVSVCAADGGRALRPTFDAVLCDAPCSNTGVLAQRPEARWRFGPAAQRDLAELQERLLDEAAELARPGGRLVWSTCTLEPEENHQRVRAFLERHPGWSLDRAIESEPRAGGPVDGGFAARLVRST